jgi:hypothetical protein
VIDEDSQSFLEIEGKRDGRKNRGVKNRVVDVVRMEGGLKGDLYKGNEGE